MGRGVSRRAASLLRRGGALQDGNQTRGAIDRAHNGLVSGWLVCTECGEATVPDVLLQISGKTVDASVDLSPRGELLHGSGVVFRFTPVSAGSSPPVELSCRVHSNTRVEIVPSTWDIPAMATFENSRWPVVSGWVAVLDPQSGPLTVHWGQRQAPLTSDVARPDVQDYLGRDGVAGFHLNLASLSGYAPTDGTILRITVGGQELARTAILDSPVEQEAGCVPDSGVLADSIPDSVAEQLAVRIRAHPPTLAGASWSADLAALGIDPESDPVVGQLGRFWTHAGESAQATAAAIVRESMHRVGVPHLPMHVTPQAGERDGGGVVDSSVHSSEVTKVCIAGLNRHKSGLGQNAVRSEQALVSAGMHVCRESFYPQAGGWSPRLAATPESIVALADHAVLMHLPIDRTLPSLSAQPALLASSRLIAYFMWELSTLPEFFVRSLDVVDEIWTATEYVAEGFRKVTDTPVRVVGHAVEVGEVETFDRRVLGVRDDDFLVHFSFDANSTVARKNPSAVVDAFHQAFEGDPRARLAIKVRNMQQVQYLAIRGDEHAQGFLARLRDDPSIVVISDEWSYSRTLGLIQNADCYLSLHRSEGFGYTLAEAMLLGTPVIATGYSGNTEFMDAADLVDADLVDVRPGEYFFWEPGMQWANADVGQAAVMLQEIRGVGRVDREVARPSSIFDITQLGQSYVSALRAGDAR